MRVIFARHGESTGNAGQPSHDLSQMALTDLGQAQARALAASWEARPSLIAMSPYLRAQQTAQPTLDRFPGVPSSVLPIAEFTYLEPARWSGTTRQQRLPFIQAYWQAADPQHCDGPGAESYAALLGRIHHSLAELAAQPADALVYAVGHGQFMQALRISLLHPGWHAAEQMRHFWPFNERHPILNTDRLVLDYAQGRWRTPALSSSP